jgi:ATP-dependent helicase HepA
VQEFVAGQRWINTIESQLGLGTVLGSDFRTVNILFLSTGETRTYAKQSAPLQRVRFSIGDTVLNHEGMEITVEAISEQEGLITYQGIDTGGQTTRMHEGQLDNFVRLDRPSDRLFNAQVDSDKWFELRYQTVLEQNRLLNSELRGLIGCRTSLIPHQLYIAHEVSRRYAPRVLLADEVGLGKTIEAGLILHRQLITEQTRRVLIIVPETLIHQWLVEMIRRFNLHFRIFDQTRCESVCESSGHENPFFSEQLVLCSLDFLTSHAERAEQAAEGQWDMVIVDEAHHLKWAPANSSREYQIIKKISAQSSGLLLLTGTPEQLGKSCHFANLRLLDPDRFHKLEDFLEEEKNYSHVASAMQALIDDRPLTPDESQWIHSMLPDNGPRLTVQPMDSEKAETRQLEKTREQILMRLLDQHGTGRVLFRNTRNVISNFPARCAIPWPLENPNAYTGELPSTAEDQLEQALCPETGYRKKQASGDTEWTQLDPRAKWLLELVRSLKRRKILVITASPVTAIELAGFLKSRGGIAAAVFHQHLNLVERDRAAAFFSNMEHGSPVMICSEIGSEGRNFQFSHDLVLFDLPLNPDLLEQRIGRLDRIGQLNTINIHLPYLENTGQETIYRWYQEGLNAFEQSCSTGMLAFEQFSDQLLEALTQDGASLDKLIEETRSFDQLQKQRLRQGRDRLLEYNSCRPQAAQKLAAKAHKMDQESTLSGYMERVFDCFGVESDIHSTECLILHPGTHLAEPFPCLPEDGVTITFDRETALSNEEVQYITWEHPMVVRVMEQIRIGELGNTALTALESPEFPSGTMLLECIYIIEATDSAEFRGHTYLPPLAIRVVVDQQGREYGSVLGSEQIRSNQRDVNLETACKIIRLQERQIRRLIVIAEQTAEKQAKAARQSARSESSRKLTTEIERLRDLRRVNRNVRDEEIEFFRNQLNAIGEMIESAPLRLDAIRVIVTL